ncbi:MAG: peptidyl-prolyl cis-trans isomerase [Betaproteobacteria bacterium]|nr:MAG: peptidyl-prolyl cis-trans isomerase [Betaproteobacteria bacterium]TDI82982.1 MAG: peptidyl-prolyl cis-trans isomerase [Betaproteobacteria bacterium]
MHIYKSLVTLSFLLCTTAFATNPQVEMKTNFGNILLELYPDKAPITVKNFLFYVKENHYKDTIFHRVIQGFMIQGGGFDKLLKLKPTKQPIENEAANGLKNEIGTIAMARTSNPHSATAQFFINVGNNTFLDFTAPTPRGYGYTVFGKVIKGMDIVNKISATPTSASKPFTRDAPKEIIVINEMKSISTTKPTPTGMQQAK